MTFFKRAIKATVHVHLAEACTRINLFPATFRQKLELLYNLIGNS